MKQKERSYASKLPTELMHKNTGNFDSKYTIAGRNDQLKVNMSYKAT